MAAGIPDPVLAEIGAARSGAMREIVATIQAEQDIVIRAPIDQALIVQGGPGTGKTAVALHRAAYLLFEHRRRLARDGVLVVGPNRAFLDYIANVLPSLGERSVRQCTALDLCIPKIDVTGVDDPETARWKGSAERLVDLERLALDAIRPPDDAVRVPIGARTHTFEAGPDRRVDRHRQVGRRPDQPTPRALARARPTGAATALRWRRLLVVGGAVEDRDQQLLAHPAPGQARRSDAARCLRPAQEMDRRRPVPRRRGQHAAERHTVHLRPRRRRRGAGSFGRGPARDRSPLAGRLDHHGRRRRPVDHAGRAGALVRRVRPPRRVRIGGRPDDRIPRARADPRHRQPVAAVDRRRRRRQPLGARRGRAAGVARRRSVRSRRRHGRGRRRRQASPPVDRRRRSAGAARARSPRRSPHAA